jgi:hypothetical protein
MILAVYKELAFIAENVANIIFTIYFMVGWVERQRNPPKLLQRWVSLSLYPPYKTTKLLHIETNL